VYCGSSRGSGIGPDADGVMQVEARAWMPLLARPDELNCFIRTGCEQTPSS
jgi:hypothetical protein